MADQLAIAKLIPTASQEEWKYSDPAPYLKLVSDAHSAVQFTAENADIQKLSSVLSTGQAHVLKEILRRANSEVVQINPQASASGHARSVIRINGSVDNSSHGAAHIHIPDNTECVLIEENDPNQNWVNTSFEITVGKNAILRHYRSLAAWGDKGVRTQTINVSVGRDARYETFTLNDGAAYNRQDVTVSLNGENSEAAIFGLHLLNGKRLGDHTVLVRHMAPNCRSDQFIRTVLLDQARGVFQGKIFVDRLGQQTNGYQMSNSLLLSPTARMDVKPELEIYADDVRCSHGSTSGPLEGDALFYLQSRGLDKRSAQRMLCTAFIAEVTERLTDKAAGETYLEEAVTWLDEHL